MELEENDFYKHLNQMINNTYDILTRKKDIYEIIEDDSIVPVFLFDPSEGYPEYNEDIYLLLIDYYEEYEEYERCQELLHAMEIHKSIS